jgi:hypothetical protein
MNTVELVQYSLDFAFEVLGMVTADLTQEQADWQPPGKASSITANYSHIITYINWFLEKILIPCDDSPFQKERPPETVLQDVQVELSDLHTRADELRKTYRAWLSSLTPADLDMVLKTSIGPLNLGHTVEAYIIWHINAHCGEISAIKGCQGIQGYPW